MANADMVEGYCDGRDPSSPEPSSNRSHSYRHGFANGRDDLHRKPRAIAAELRKQADLAMDLDDAGIGAAAIEARQRANGCNQDDEPGDWGRPCCDRCCCADEAAGRESHADECRKMGLPI